LWSEIKEIQKYWNCEHCAASTHKSKDGTDETASYQAGKNLHEVMMYAKGPSVINRRAFWREFLVTN
jgi:hypothetical protein